MIFQIENIVQTYFNKPALEDVTVAELEQLVAEHPYLAPAQYFLAKKYIQTGHPHYKKQISKTALFFNNPHWLSLLLQDQVFNKNELREDYISVDEDRAGIAVVQEETPLMQEEMPADTVAVVEEKRQLSTTSDSGAPVFPHLTAGEPVETAEENVPTEILPPTENPLPVEPEIVSAVELAKEAIPVTALQPNEEIKEATIQTPSIAEPGPVKATADEKTIADDEVLPRLPFERLSLKLSELPADGSIPIEPLHTVDYFASQGIKLREIEGKDKLSVKLRSFTEWLKTMKRIHPEKLEEESEEQVQSKIQHIAEHSNEANEVVTEAMADVFAQQGLNQKAMEVYQKLSLQNPNKRAYFAAKISKLNDH